MCGTENKNRLTMTIIGTIFNVIYLLNIYGHKMDKEGFIYILVWSPQKWTPFDIIPMERKAFEKCIFTNCFLTGNHSYFKNIMDFDVLMFAIWQVGLANLDSDSSATLPSNRSEKQTYCLYTMEAQGFHKIYDSWNGFFNMTFTFKITSNSTIPYVVIRDDST